MTDPVTWRVVNQRQTTAQGPAGGYVPVVQVTYQLSTGTTRTVNVPVAGITPQIVEAAIQADAETAAAIDGLTSDTTQG